MNFLPIFAKLIERYDYGGAYEVLKEHGLENGDAGILVNVCRYSVNFDFHTAKYLLTTVSQEAHAHPLYNRLKENLSALNDGHPDALMSELLENMRFQIVNEEYIDFLGRVYRFKEAIYKYMFIKSQRLDKAFTMKLHFLQKKEILKILRKQYRIFNGNLIYALEDYFRRDKTYAHVSGPIIQRMNTDRMDALIDLRHNSLIGHGFMGVSLPDIQRTYGNPYNVLEDFKVSLIELGVHVDQHKYTDINTAILEHICAESGQAMPEAYRH